MSAVSSKTLTNHELVLLAVYLLGGETSPIDTEDIAVKADELSECELPRLKAKG